MPVFESGLEQEAARQVDGDEGEEQSAPESLRDFSQVEPFGEHVEQGQEAANQLQLEVAGGDDLSDGYGEEREISGGEQVAHFPGGKGRAGDEGVEEGSAKPHRGVQEANESQKADHGSAV